MIKKTIVIAGQQGERGDKAEEYSVPIDGVLGYTETGTPDGYVDAGYFKVTGLDEVDSRIDVIESLPEGSTSGDAEVADIRVGVDGEIYDSAGIAVRDQITELHDYAESIDDVQDAQIETLKVTKAVEGEYITINDAAALPANEYALTLSPVQEGSGDPSPTNVRPIHGADEVGVRVCGKNLFNITYTDWQKDSDYAFLPISGFDGGVYNMSFTDKDTSVSLSGIYVGFMNINGTPSGSDPYRWVINNGVIASDKTNIQQYGGSVRCNSMIIYPKNENTFNALLSRFNVQVEKGETATDFEPYTLHSTTITLPSTVYGGSVDSDTGVLTVTHGAVVFDGSYDENWYSITTGTNANRALCTNVSNAPTGSDYSWDLIGNYVKSTGTAQSMPPLWEACFNPTGYLYVGIPTTITTVEDWRAYLAQNPLQICFELATPTDISVTPFPQTLLEGVNNVWAECSEDGAVIGDAEQDLTYQRDTTLVIQNLINRIEELERRN